MHLSSSTRRLRRIPAVLAVSMAALLMAVWLAPTASAARSAQPATSSVSLTKLAADPFTDANQHATEVEPDSFAFGSTIVASSQVGRNYDGGSSDLSYNTSTDGGLTWHSGVLPGITVAAGGTWQKVSDASVAYDAKHGTWMIGGLVLNSSYAAGFTVSRSTDGLTWQNPVLAVGNDGQTYDKDWIVCDNTPSSPHYGNCYLEADITSSSDKIIMSTSSDGGLTWSAPVSPADAPLGLAGQPLVQPDGNVVVPYWYSAGSQIRSFASADGGASWNASVLVSAMSTHTVDGGLRASPLPSAALDAAGEVYVSWQDCRFRSHCSSNDIVYSTSSDGTAWTAPVRVPIDDVGSTVDHFIPGFGVDRTTSGASTKLGLYYYFYPNAKCTSSTCQLEVGYVSSHDAGATWSPPQTVGGPMSLSQLADTSSGRMVGDYLGTSIVNGSSVCLFAIGVAPTNGQAYDEAMYVVPGGLPVS